jgi:hypothetical protein
MCALIISSFRATGAKKSFSLRKCFGRSKPLPYGMSDAKPYGEYKFG